MHWLRTRKAFFVVPIVAVWVLSIAAPARSVTKSEVDAACADSAEAYGKWKEAKANAAAAEDRYDQANDAYEEVSLRVFQFRERIDEKAQAIEAIHDTVMDRAVELYMNGGAPSSGLMLFAPSVDAAITGQEFLSAITSGDISAVDQLDALKRDLQRSQAELQEQQKQLAVLTEETAVATEEMAAIMEEIGKQAQRLSSTCRNLQSKYAQQQAAAAAAAAARRTGAARGVPPEVTPGFICPMDPAVVHFRDTWGAPRSGGRTHKGTDVFAPMGQPMYAVADGRVRVYDNHLGGHSIFLTATYGTGYYYAHLSRWAAGLKTGDHVTKGQVIGYNGNSGNADGGAPHLHFQIHPNMGSPVNPYPTLKRACG